MYCAFQPISRSRSACSYSASRRWIVDMSWLVRDLGELVVELMDAIVVEEVDSCRCAC